MRSFEKTILNSIFENDGEANMNRKILLLIATFLVIVVILVLTHYVYLRFQEVANHSWLKPGSYMLYEQFFIWNEQSKTDYMKWNITKLEDNLAALDLTSHGVNVTTGSVELTIGEVNLTMDTITREVVNCSDPYYVGEKWPFWIETNVTIGATIDIWYGTNVISKNETICVLGKQRDCWVVEYNWRSGSMKRWFDKSSGILLKIYNVLYRQGITIVVTATAVLTNIDLES